MSQDIIKITLPSNPSITKVNVTNLTSTITGPIGATGSSGLVGATGLQGTTGPIGATGSSGLVGATGLQGTTGPIGATGSSGLVGATGLQGTTGPIGATGSSGLVGATGPTSTSPAGGTGFIQYYSTSSTLGGNTNLYWDIINARLGIGTQYPTAKLHVVGGKILLDNTQGIQIKDAAGTARPIVQVDGGDNLYLDSTAAGGDIYLRASGAEKLSIKGTSGNVGIGTIMPTAKLHVYGGNLKQDNGTYNLLISDGATITGSNHIIVDAAASYLQLKSTSNSIFFTQNSVNSFYSDSVGAVVNTLYLKQGNVGIGTTTPTARLEVVGDALVNNLTVGLGTGSVATNTVVGYQATLNNVSGSGITAIGYQALQNIITNINSVAVGYQALANLTNGVNTFGVIVGGSGYVDGTYTPVQLIYSSGTTSTTYPTVTIVVAGGVVTSVTKLTTGTGFRDTTTVMTATAASIGGTGSGFTVATGTRTGNAASTAVGYSALFNNTTGSSNTAVGASVLYTNTTGATNVAVGSAAMYYNTTGSSNTAICGNALYNNTTGSNNIAIGYQVLYRNTTGSNNIAIGTNAGRYTTGPTDNNATSSTSIYIGNSTGAFADGQTNQIVIGEGAIGNGSNTVTLGHTTIATTILRGNVTATAGSLALKIPTTVATSTYTMTSTDSTLIFTGGNCTVTLLAAATYPGRIVYITNAAAGTVISATSNVVPGGSVTAGTAILSNAAGHFAWLQSDGTNWITIMTGSGN